jgi:hypothetical protein
MRKTSILMLTAVVLTAFLLLVRLGNCEFNKMSPQGPGYSSTLDESKRNGFFQYEAIADRARLTLDSGLEFEIKSAWVENCWTKQILVVGTSPPQKQDGYQLIITLNIDSTHGEKNSDYFYFVGNKHLETFIHYNCNNYYSNRIDTIKVPLYRETSSELPSRRERKAFDTLTFVKRQISR